MKIIEIDDQVVCLSMSVITKISPYENLRIENSMWLFYGSLMKQSVAISERPKSFSVNIYLYTLLWDLYDRKVYKYLFIIYRLESLQ